MELTKETPRKATVRVTYEKRAKAGKGTGKRPAPAMAEYNEGFTYTDVASGESDTMSIELADIDLRWAGRWMPRRGDKMEAEIVVGSWGKAGERQAFHCGRFCVDEISYEGPELTCTVGGVSVPEGNSFRSTGRSKTWKGATLKEIASEIAIRYHLGLSYTGDEVRLGTVEQSDEPDSTFLKKACEDCGMAIKIYSGEIVIYDKAVNEALPPAVTLKREDLQKWSYNSTIIGTYTGARIKYTSGKDDKELECVVGGGKRMLNINEKVDSLQEAQRKACARVNAENEKAATMSVTIMADTRVAAGATVQIQGLCHLSGKYFVDKVTHNIGPDEAYTMTLDLHKCQKRITLAGAADAGQGTAGGGFAAGDKVVVDGLAYWGGNGGRANQCSGMEMYITEVLGEGYKYQYGVAKRAGGTRYGWCEKSSLRKA